MKGCEKEVEIPYDMECEVCHGTGCKPGTSKEKCSKCGGKGQIVYTQQSIFGMTRSTQVCPQCNGTGEVVKEKCSSCYGSGYKTIRKKISVKIPAGVDNGNKISISALGKPGKNGGPRGDLYVVVSVSSHPVFEREELSIFSVVPISFATACLGGEIRIATIDGEVAYDVKAGTQPNTRIRLKGKGVPYYRDNRVRGDHYVTLKVVVPEKLNSEQKEALRAFDDAMNGRTGDAKTEGKKRKKFF